MAVREVLRYPHPALKASARELEAGEGERATRVAADLVETMRSFPRCVGIAAPQINEPVRMVVVDVSEHPQGEGGSGLLVLVNPRIVASSGAEAAREGCLSIPELTANVRRALAVTIEAVSAEGEPLVVESKGFEARCLQHELDHLDGILFLDRVDSIDHDVFRRKRPG